MVKASVTASITLFGLGNVLDPLSKYTM